MTFTLGVGWLVWLWFTSKTAQTPAKRLAGMYIVDANTLRPISAVRVWLREITKVLLVPVNPLGVINWMWVLLDRDRQALHDKLFKTLVVNAPQGWRGNG